MSTRFPEDAMASSSSRPRPAPRADVLGDRSGWVTFAVVMLTIVGILNVIYGIGAIDDSSFFAHNTQYLVSDTSLNTYGWVTLILGVLQIVAAVSIWQGGAFGQFFGILVAGLSMVGALLSLPAYPFWSLAVFAVDVLIIYGLAAYGGQRVTTT